LVCKGPASRSSYPSHRSRGPHWCRKQLQPLTCPGICWLPPWTSTAALPRRQDAHQSAMSSMDTDSEEVDVSLEAAVGAAGLFAPLLLLSVHPRRMLRICAAACATLTLLFCLCRVPQALSSPHPAPAQGEQAVPKPPWTRATWAAAGTPCTVCGTDKSLAPAPPFQCHLLTLLRTPQHALHVVTADAATLLLTPQLSPLLCCLHTPTPPSVHPPEGPAGAAGPWRARCSSTGVQDVGPPAGA
jgi:hypothetical protein